MKNPRTMRTLLLAGLIIPALLVVAFEQVRSFPPGMALEPGDSFHAGIPHPKGKVLYVSPEGSNAWSGKLAEPNRAKSDGPFATLARARDAIRSMQARQPLHKPVTVYVRG